MKKVELTVIIAFGNVPDDANLEDLAVEGITNAVRLLDGAGVIKDAELLGYETTDAIGQEDFVVQEEQ